MKILDKYIIKKYLGTFFYLVLGLCLIICVIDYSEKSDDFMAAKLGLAQVFVGYYAHLIPYLANFLSPLMVFISTILVTARLAGHTEIIAMLAGGISFKRIIATYLLGASLLAALTFYLIGWVIPNSNTERINFELTYVEKETDFEARDVHLRADDSTYVYLQHFVSASNTGYHFTVETFKNKDLVYRLKSSKVQWDSIGQTWDVPNYSERTYRNGKENYLFSTNQKKISLNLEPDDFGPGYLLHQTLTIPELREYIQKESGRGTGGMGVFISEYHERFAYPFAIIILTFMGVVVSARKSREGIAQQLVIGFVLCFIYYGFLQLGKSFTQSEDLHPMVSAWIPNTVFLLAGLVLYRALPK